MERSLAEHQQEMYEDLWWKRQELQFELERNTALDKDVGMKQLAAIEKALGIKPKVHDSLAEKWTEQFMRGEIPDLDEMPGD